MLKYKDFYIDPVYLDDYKDREKTRIYKYYYVYYRGRLLTITTNLVQVVKTHRIYCPNWEKNK